MISKKIDSLGRIGIPKPIREELGFTPNTILLMESRPNLRELVLRIQEERCIKCEATEDLIELKEGAYLCHDCLKKISKR